MDEPTKLESCEEKQDDTSDSIDDDVEMTDIMSEEYAAEAAEEEESTNNETTATEEETNKEEKKESKPPKKTEPRAKEIDVGIKEFISDHKGFFGIIKQRFSDFIVNEINDDGEVVELTDKTVASVPLEQPEPEEEPRLPPTLTPELLLDIKALADRSIPGQKGATLNGNLSTKSESKDVQKEETKTTENQENSKAENESKEEKTTNDETTNGADVKKEDGESTQETEDAEKVTKEATTKEVSKPKVQKSKLKREVIIDVTGLEKTERADIHRYIKAHFRNVCANTESKGEEKTIIVKAGFDRRTAISLWPKDKLYTTFTLYKENIDTMEAINIITWRLRLRADKFGYAGTKDRRGKTSQQISAYQIYPERISNVTNNYENIHVGNFTFKKEGLRLGKLKGNRFRTVIREVSAEDEEIYVAIESLTNNGFINYYGMQRFGTTNVPTYSIGVSLLKNDWKEAVDLILKQRDIDSKDLSKARQIWSDSQNASSAYAALVQGNKFSVEAKLLKGLMQTNKNDYLSAIFKIPSKTRMLYLHAYQSYIWNNIVSRRIQKYGMAVLPGDLIVKKSENGAVESLDTSNSCQDTEFIEEFSCRIYPNDKIDSESKSPEDEAANDKDTENDESEKKENEVHNKIEVHVLSEEEAKTEDIKNIVLPLPGFSMTYPENELKEWYTELLEKDGLTLENLKNKHKAFSLGGSYRHIVVRPDDTSGEVCYYDDPSKPLVTSDIEKINGVDVSENCLLEGKHKAVILDFKLPPSSYATMALRELLKMDTSPQYMSSLNSSSIELPWESSGYNKKNNKPMNKFNNSQRGRFMGRNMNNRGNRGWGRGVPHGGRGLFGAPPVRPSWGDGGRFHRGGRGGGGGWRGDRGGPARGPMRGRGGGMMPPPPNAAWSGGPYGSWGPPQGGWMGGGPPRARGWVSVGARNRGGYGGNSRGNDWRGRGRGNKRQMGNDGFRPNKRGKF